MPNREIDEKKLKELIENTDLSIFIAVSYLIAFFFLFFVAARLALAFAIFSSICILALTYLIISRLLSIRSELKKALSGMPELTTQEKIERNREEIELAKKEIERVETEKNLFERQIELAKKKKELEMLLEGKLLEDEDKKIANDFLRRIKGIKDYGEVEEMAKEEMRLNPQLAEYIEALLDVYRKDLLEDR